MSLAEVGSPFTTSYVQTDALGQPNACYATLAGYNSRVPGTINGSPCCCSGSIPKNSTDPCMGLAGL